MEASYADFNHLESAGRVRDILAIPDSAFVERDDIAPREELTFENGFYVAATAVFVDIRGSTQLAQQVKMPMLARINRVFVSEMVAVLRDHTGVREMFIEGDCVWAVYNTTLKHEIDMAFTCCARAASLINNTNFYLGRRGVSALKVGIGMHYGRALMVKAGHKGSGINEIVWNGPLVSTAAELCSFGNKTYNDDTIMISKVAQENLNDKNRGLLRWNANRNCFHGDVVNNVMHTWLTEERARLS